MVVRLPLEKLAWMKTELIKWRGRKACKKRVAVPLFHVCKVVRAGRSFLRRLVDLSMTAKQLDHFIRLSKEAKSDIEWRFRFSEDWNGVGMMYSVKEASIVAVLISDASGSWGCGAYCGTDYATVGGINQRMPKINGVNRGSCSVIGKRLGRQDSVLARCDNTAVVVSTVN